jgi:putative endonuclease
VTGFCIDKILKIGNGLEGMHYVYVLFSEIDRMLYVGSTKDLRKRWKDHCAGRADATKDRRPLRVIYYEVYLTQYEAGRREKYLKGGNGRGQLKKQLSVTLEKVNYRFKDSCQA